MKPAKEGRRPVYALVEEGRALASLEGDFRSQRLRDELERNHTMSRAITFDAADCRGSGPENYERYFVPTIGAPLADDLIAAASLQPTERVLDVACGTGVVTRRAAERIGTQGSVAGLDVNPCMLEVARAVTPERSPIQWYQTSMDAMSLPNDSFDVVLCQMGLQFVPDKLQALKEIRRVLRSGGRIVLNLPGPAPELFTQLADSLARCIDPACAGFVNVVFSLHDSDELRRLMSEAGFENIDIVKTRKSLALPAPVEFLWQYIHSTPLGQRVAEATDAQRAALADDVCDRWRALMAGRETLTVDVPMTTVSAR